MGRGKPCAVSFLYSSEADARLKSETGSARDPMWTSHLQVKKLSEISKMTKDREGMTCSNTAIFILLIMPFTFSGVAHSADTVEEIKACARMTDRDARFACFDALGKRVLREESANNKPTQEKLTQPEAETATTSDAQPLPDELADLKTIKYVGFITSCKKGRSGYWYFTFDNGQVWREANKRNLRFKECSFSATITRDMFGYKMRIDGVRNKIRVRREQ